VLIAVTLLYFLPTVIALSRGHLSALAIFLLDLFLGWTVLGWLIAFIWSCTGNTAANFYRAAGEYTGPTDAMAPRRSNSLWLILLVIIVAIVLLDKPRQFRDVRSFEFSFPTEQGLRL
jgi:hypothetical protein